MAIEEISVKEAFEVLKTDENSVLVDVRSVGEFESGYPSGALNIPIMHHSAETGQMLANPDFLEVMLSAVPKSKRVLLSCRSGGRSMQACKILADNGYERLANVQGGFVGTPGEAGWEPSGLPVSREVEPKKGYTSLLEKAKNS